MQYYIRGKPPFNRNTYPNVIGISPVAPYPSTNGSSDSMTRKVLRRVLNYSFNNGLQSTPERIGMLGGSGPFRNSYNSNVTTGNNPKFVVDASDYSRFKKQVALARNYSDYKK